MRSRSRNAASTAASPSSVTGASGRRPHSHSSTSLGLAGHRGVGGAVAAVERDGVGAERAAPRAPGRPHRDGGAGPGVRVDAVPLLLVERRPVLAQEQVEHLVDAVDRQVGVDGRGGAPPVLDVEPVHGGLLRHAPVPEPDGLILGPPGVGRRLGAALAQDGEHGIERGREPRHQVGARRHRLVLARLGATLEHDAGDPAAVHVGRVIDAGAHVPAGARRDGGVERPVGSRLGQAPAVVLDQLEVPLGGHGADRSGALRAR